MHMYNHLVQIDHSNLSIIKSLHLIASVYDLNELRHSNAINPNNILSITEENWKILSPHYFSFIKWAANDKLMIRLYIGDADTPKLIEQTKNIQKIFQQFNINNQSKILKNFDHFDIVEELSNEQHEIVIDIINESKL